MTLCELCIQECGLTGFFPWSFGPCEVCGQGSRECFDIPAAMIPEISIWDKETGQPPQT